MTVRCLRVYSLPVHFLNNSYNIHFKFWFKHALIVEYNTLATSYHQLIGSPIDVSVQIAWFLLPEGGNDRDPSVAY